MEESESNHYISELARKLKETAEVISNSVIIQQDTWYSTIAQLAEYSKHTFELQEDKTKQMLSEISQMVKSVNFSYLESISELQQQYLESEKILAPVESECISIMVKYGWPPLLDVEFDYVFEIVREYRENPSDEFGVDLSKAIIEFFEDMDYREIESRWKKSKILKKRIEILLDVIDAHRNEKYTLSIPTLLPQIEGVLSEECKIDYNTQKRKINAFVDYILMEHDKYIPIKGLIIDGLFERFVWGDMRIPTLSRHAILHGADVNYGTKENSLKIILIFDFIVYLLENER